MNTESDTLSPGSRYLFYGVAGLFAILGLIFFAAPAWATTNFLWKVTPFVTMTIGGWYVGNAIVAWDSARTARWSAIYPSLAYLSLFSVLETAVVVLHRDLLRLTFALSWFYLFTLAVAVAVALVSGWALLRRRPELPRAGATVPFWITALVAAFVIFVLGLAGAGIAGPSTATDGSVFPDKITPFTVHAFVAFFLALAVGGSAWLLFVRSAEAIVVFVRDGLALLIPLLLAALVNLGDFDLAARPGGWVYLGSYLAALIAVGLILRYGRAQRVGLTPAQTGA